ncbi:hypothetical protein L1049_002973 [Liquidambar formosana]|uniref:Uncharacterized protein n=1 Tax=Liquidambar formosana TaxID=63359 RepID=A0AAP0NLH5_LIQFO
MEAEREEGLIGCAGNKLIDATFQERGAQVLSVEPNSKCPWTSGPDLSDEMMEYGPVSKPV